MTKETNLPIADIDENQDLSEYLPYKNLSEIDRQNSKKIGAIFSEAIESRHELAVSGLLDLLKSSSQDFYDKILICVVSTQKKESF